MKYYCDLDGVLADFDSRVLEVCGKLPHELEPKVMWSKLARCKDFYYSLQWTADGKELWEWLSAWAFGAKNITILTGLPFGNWARGQKIRWCQEQLGYDIPVITCWSREKHLHSGPEHVLIDDRLKLQDKWREAGGIFIYHTNTKDTIRQIKDTVSSLY